MKPRAGIGLVLLLVCQRVFAGQDGTEGGRYYLAAALGSSSPPQWRYAFTPTVTGKIEQERGAVLRLAVGRRFAALRAEVELEHSTFAFRSLRAGNLESTPLDGMEYRYLFSLNGYYDFSVVGPVRPYVGAGLTAGVISWKGAKRPGTTSNVNDYDGISTSHIQFGVQLPLGSRWQVGMEYRYTAAPRIQLVHSSDNAIVFDGDDWEAITAQVTYRY